MSERITETQGQSPSQRMDCGLAQSTANALVSSGGRVLTGSATAALCRDGSKAIRGAALVTILAVAWCQAAIAAQSEPTLEDTVAYMNAKLALCPTGFAQSVALDDHKSIMANGHSVGRPGRYQTRLRTTGRHRVRFSLADLRLNVGVSHLEEDQRHQIENEPYDITVVSVQCAEVGCVEVHTSTHQSEIRHWAERFLYPGQRATEYHFFVCDDDEVDRFQKALTHALELGGAQQELF